MFSAYFMLLSFSTKTLSKLQDRKGCAVNLCHGQLAGLSVMNKVEKSQIQLVLLEL